MNRVRNFTESELSADEKKAIRLLVSKKVLDSSVWTEEDFTDEELLQVCKDALKESQQGPAVGGGGISGNTPRLLRSVWLLCVLDSKTKFLSAVATSFAVSCPSNKKLVTAFHNITFPKPNDRVVNLNEPYYIVRRLYPKQTLDENAIEVKFSGNGDYDRDWAVLDVVCPEFTFTDTLPLRDSTKPLPLTTERSLLLNTLYYKVGLHHVNNPEFMEATATHPLRMDHVYSKLVEMPTGLYAGASGAPMVDEEESVVAIHVESISEVDFPNKRIKVSDVASEVSSSHAHSRYGSIIFNLDAVRVAID